MNPIQDVLSFGLQQITSFILQLLDLLPGSPFGEMLDFIDSFDFLGYLNWFIPFDMAATFMNLWLAAIGAYYLYKYSAKVLQSLGYIKDSIL